MPEELLATFSVRRLSILNEAGEVDESLMPELSDDQILRMHELIVLAAPLTNGHSLCNGRGG